MSAPVRTWVQSTLVNDSALAAIIAGRVYQMGGVIGAQTTKPYLVHHFGNNTDEGMYDQDNLQPNRQYLQVFIHVDQGDYGPIDDLVPLVKNALNNGPGKPGSLIEVQYLETSQDLQDNLLQTYFRYMRFQLILSR